MEGVHLGQDNLATSLNTRVSLTFDTGDGQRFRDDVGSNELTVYTGGRRVAGWWQVGGRVWQAGGRRLAGNHTLRGGWGGIRRLPWTSQSTAHSIHRCQKNISELDRGADCARLRHICMCIQGSHANEPAASTQAKLHRAVRRGQGGAGLHSGCHLRRCKRRQGAYRQEAGGRDCRSKNFGARAARRELREERKAACTRHGEPPQARPRPHARLGRRGAGRGERDGIGRGMASSRSFLVAGGEGSVDE
jgi:hypothetical protein